MRQTQNSASSLGDDELSNALLLDHSLLTTRTKLSFSRRVSAVSNPKRQTSTTNNNRNKKEPKATAKSSSSSVIKPSVNGKPSESEKRQDRRGNTTPVKSKRVPSKRSKPSTGERVASKETNSPTPEKAKEKIKETEEEKEKENAEEDNDKDTQNSKSFECNTVKTNSNVGQDIPDIEDEFIIDSDTPGIEQEKIMIESTEQNTHNDLSNRMVDSPVEENVENTTIMKEECGEDENKKEEDSVVQESEDISYNVDDMSINPAININITLKKPIGHSDEVPVLSSISLTSTTNEDNSKEREAMEIDICNNKIKISEDTADSNVIEERSRRRRRTRELSLDGNRSIFLDPIEGDKARSSTMNDNVSNTGHNLRDSHRQSQQVSNNHISEIHDNKRPRQRSKSSRKKSNQGLLQTEEGDLDVANVLFTNETMLLTGPKEFDFASFLAAHPVTIPPLNPTKTYPKRRIVFVDPDDEQAKWWWPAMVVPPEEIEIFRKSVGVESGVECGFPEENEILVVYFEDGSLCVLAFIFISFVLHF